MRERLVLAFVGLTLAVIALYGVPRAYYLADLVRDQQSAALDGTADTLAALAEERRDAGGTVDRALLEHGLVAADHVHLAPEQGEPVAVGGAVADPGDGLTERRTLDDGSTLTLTIEGSTVSRGVREAITPLVVIGLALAALAALLGAVIARRLARPFRELADAARSLGHGRFDIDVPSYSVPEAEAIGASLRGAAGRLDLLVRRERELAVNASHQLRTPITALRLSLEDLSLWPETPPEVRAELEHALAELDRLSGAIDELLDLARGRRLMEQSDVDLASVVAACARRWEQPLQEAGRALDIRVTGSPAARVVAGPVEQVLDVLLDNARRHGQGTVTVETRDAGTHLEVAVQDEGTARLDPDVLRRGDTARSAGGAADGGLGVAAELAELAGGRLTLDEEALSTRFVLWLPRSPLPLSP